MSNDNMRLAHRLYRVYSQADGFPYILTILYAGIFSASQISQSAEYKQST